MLHRKLYAPLNVDIGEVLVFSFEIAGDYRYADSATGDHTFDCLVWDCEANQKWM